MDMNRKGIENILVVFLFLMVLVVGWLGGTLTFGHGIGVYGHRPDADSSDAADEALDE